MKIQLLRRNWQSRLSGMGKRHTSVVVVVFLMILIGATAIWQAHPWDTRSKGERLYAAHCAECHGPEGQGGIGMALDSTGHMYQHTCSQLKLHIAIGSRGSGYMPAYWGQLSEEEMTAIILTFQQWWTDEQIREFLSRTSCVKNDAVSSILQQDLSGQ